LMKYHETTTRREVLRGRAGKQEAGRLLFP
jgi:hypothetical protein